MQRIGHDEAAVAGTDATSERISHLIVRSIVVPYNDEFVLLSDVVDSNWPSRPW